MAGLGNTGNPYTAAAAQAATGTLPNRTHMGGGGWQGLGGLLSFLQGNINNSQYQNMYQGAQGHGFGAIGGAHGAASGLSPWAISYLMQAKDPTTGLSLMGKNPSQTVATTDAQGNPLTGVAAMMANMENSLDAAANPTYSLQKGVDQGMLGKLLQTWAHSTGHNIYGHGFGANPTMPTGLGGGFKGGAGSRGH